MLRTITIEEYGLIARAEIDFAPGMTAFTGETGSGKTMLLGALGFALGDRTSADAVRAGAERARVTLEIDPDDGAGVSTLDVPLDPGEPAIVQREIQTSGKSSARVNGRPVPAATLRTLGSGLVDRVGQHEAQRLLDRAHHLEMLDRFAGAAAAAARRTVVETYERSVRLAVELARFDADAAQREAARSAAALNLAEIDAAKIEAGEDTRLRERRELLVHAERIATALAQAHGLLVDEGGATESLGTAAASLRGIERFGERFASLAASSAALQSEAGDIALALGRELEAMDFEAGELEAVVARLDALETLKRKYGGTLDAVFAARSRAAGLLADDATRDERRERTHAAAAAAKIEFDEACACLRSLRVEAARALEAAIVPELSALAMPNARFDVVVGELDVPGPGGSETIEFAVSTNAGEPVRPLAKVASGGELSRVLLALVVVLAGRRERSTLVFDEIDAGIGGATAVAVGERLGALARTTQVVCVTHLAQIAAWADAHVVLFKSERNGSTAIHSQTLADEASAEAEIARMLSGRDSDAAREHARALRADVLVAKGRRRTA